MRDQQGKAVLNIAYGIVALGVFLAFWVMAVEPGLPGDAGVHHALGAALFFFAVFFLRRFVPASCERRAEARARRRAFRGY